MIIDRNAILTAADNLALVFQRNGWTWADSTDDGTTHVPGAAEIALTIRDLIDHLVPGGSVGSGRLQVIWEDGDPDEQEITLTLELGRIAVPTAKDTP